MNAKDVKYHFKKYFGYDMPQTQINVFSPEFIDFCLYIASQQSVHRTANGACENCGNNCWKLVCETCGAE